MLKQAHIIGFEMEIHRTAYYSDVSISAVLLRRQPSDVYTVYISRVDQGTLEDFKSTGG